MLFTSGYAPRRTPPRRNPPTIVFVGYVMRVMLYANGDDRLAIAKA